MFNVRMLQVQAAAAVACFHPDARERAQGVALLGALSRGYRTDNEDREWLFGAWLKSNPLVDQNPGPKAESLTQ